MLTLFSLASLTGARYSPTNSSFIFPLTFISQILITFYSSTNIITISDAEQVAASEPTTEPSGSGVDTNTAYIHWDIKGGSDRDHYPTFDTWQPLEGTPAIDLWLYLGDEGQQFSGPTEGKVKIDPRRVSKYKIVQR
uniref:Uncharacterized protein n=1 Tax=Gibberella zeae TaxID=5518 RepID=A0A4E9DBU6_GIBZA